MLHQGVAVDSKAPAMISTAVHPVILAKISDILDNRMSLKFVEMRKRFAAEAAPTEIGRDSAIRG